MKNLLFNLDSVEVSYGDNVLNSVIQINERINDIAEFHINIDKLNDFEKTQIADRLSKLIELNHKIQRELEDQVSRLSSIKLNAEREVIL